MLSAFGVVEVAAQQHRYKAAIGPHEFKRVLDKCLRQGIGRIGDNSLSVA
jgi:hypothetical protein